MNTHDIAHPAYISVEAEVETPKDFYLREEREQRQANSDMVEMEKAFRRAYQQSLFRRRNR